MKYIQSYFIKKDKRCRINYFVRDKQGSNEYGEWLFINLDFPKQGII